MLWEQIDKENDCLTSSVKGYTNDVFCELSFKGWVWVFQVYGSRNQIKERALEAERIACATHGKCEYVGHAYGTPGTLKWLEHRIMDGESQKMRLATNAGAYQERLYELCQGIWYLCYRLLDPIKKFLVREVTGLDFCFWNIKLGLLWKGDGRVCSGAVIEDDRPVRRLW